MAKLLIEQEPHFTTLQIVEGSGSGKLIAEGEFGRCDVPTKNGRIYPRKLVQREFERLSEDLKNRRIVGELDHPSDGKTSLQRASHVITDLRIESDGRVIGKTEILNTAQGKNLKALIEGGVQVGVSSRGLGTTRAVESGEEVQEDFKLNTYDFVADPAVGTARPVITTEDVDTEQPTLAELFVEAFPDVVNELQEAAKKEALASAKDKAVSAVDNVADVAVGEVRAEMIESFEKQIASTIIEAREDISSELREEFANDPAVGGSKAILAQIAELVGAYRSTPEQGAMEDALKAKDLEVAEANNSVSRAVIAGQIAVNQAYIEKTIGSHPKKKSIRELMRHSDSVTLEDVKVKLEKILSDFGEIEEDTVTEEEASLREENAEMRGHVSLLEEKIDGLTRKQKKLIALAGKTDEMRVSAESQLEEALDKIETVGIEAEKKVLEAADLAEEYKLEAYKSSKVAGFANGRELSGLLESANSKADVDALIARKGTRKVSDGRLQQMRDGLQRGNGASDKSLTEERVAGENPRVSGGAAASQLDEIDGIPMADLLEMAGANK